MRLSFAGKLFAAAVGAKVISNGLRWVANQLPGGELECNCPHCGATATVPHAGQFNCWNCSGNFTVSAG